MSQAAPPETEAKEAPKAEAAPKRAPVAKSAPAPEAPATPEPTPFDAAMIVITAAEHREALRTHPVISGLAGDIAKNLRAVDERRSAAEAQAFAEKQLLVLAETDPDAFAERFRTEKQAEQARREIEGLHLEARKEAAAQVGSAVHLLPKDEQPTPAEFAEIAQAVAHLPENEIIPKYTSLIWDKVGEKRAEKNRSAIRNEEREAARTEAAGQRIRTAAAPDLREGATQSLREGEPDWRRDPAGWTRWRDEQRRGR